MKGLNRFYNIISVVLLCICTFYANAQTVCTQTLRQARTVFDEGRVHELPSLLESCIDNGFTDEERTEAYRLLILSYLYLDEPEKADEAMLALLRDNPQFQINERADPAELINLYKTFRTNPIFRIGGKLGPNVSFVNLENIGGVNNLNVNSNGSRGEYSIKLGFQAGFVVDIPITDKFTLNPELHFKHTSFEYKNDLFKNSDGTVASNNILIENQNWIELPVMIQYKVINSELNPYIALGGSVDYLISAAMIANREVLNEQPVRENTLDFTQARNTLNYSIEAAIGLKSRFKQGYFITELRFKYGLRNLSDSQQILEAVPEYIFDYNGHYNDFSLNQLMLSVGYVLDVYNPKKLRD